MDQGPANCPSLTLRVGILPLPLAFRPIRVVDELLFTCFGVEKTAHGIEVTVVESENHLVRFALWVWAWSMPEPNEQRASLVHSELVSYMLGEICLLSKTTGKR